MGETIEKALEGIEHRNAIREEIELKRLALEEARERRWEREQLEAQKWLQRQELHNQWKDAMAFITSGVPALREKGERLVAELNAKEAEQAKDLD